MLSTSVQMVKEEVQAPIGDYNWQLVDLENQVFDFQKQEKKVVLINFWATWCAPCVAEMPSMQGLYDDYKDKLTFMFVTSDQREKVAAFIQKNTYDFPVYYPLSEEPKMLRSKVLPTTFIINKEGRIVVAETGAADWNSKKTRAVLNDLLLE